MLIFNKLEYGDYQTPLNFCEKVVNIIQKEVNPSIILEPTFGIGNFIKATNQKFDRVKKYMELKLIKNILKKYKI